MRASWAYSHCVVVVRASRFLSRRLDGGCPRACGKVRGMKTVKVRYECWDCATRGFVLVSPRVTFPVCKCAFGERRITLVRSMARAREICKRRGTVRAL